MTIFIEQEELLKIFEKQLNLSNDVKLRINIKLGSSGVDNLWIEENYKFDTDIKTNKKDN